MHIPGIKIAMPVERGRRLRPACARRCSTTIRCSSSRTSGSTAAAARSTSRRRRSRSARRASSARAPTRPSSRCRAWSTRRVAAAEVLAARGISVEVIDPRTIAPLDMDTILASVRKTMRLVVAHDAHKTGGFGAELAARVHGGGVRLPRRAGRARRGARRADPLHAGRRSRRSIRRPATIVARRRAAARDDRAATARAALDLDGGRQGAALAGRGRRPRSRRATRGRGRDRQGDGRGRGAGATGSLAIVAGEGAIVPVDGVLGRAARTAPAAAAAAAPAAERARAGGAASCPRQRVATARRRPIASPAARRLAAERGIDLGRRSRQRARRPHRRARPRQAAAAAGRAPHAGAPDGAGLREAVVRNIAASWQQIPHVHIGGELAADGLVAAREARRAPSGKVTVTDLLAFALARALREVPELNGTLGPDGSVGPSEAVAPLARRRHARTASSRPCSATPARCALDGSPPSAPASSPPRGPGRSTGATSPAARSRSRTSAPIPVDFFAPVVSGPADRDGRDRAASPRSRWRRTAGSRVRPACGRTSRSTTAPPTARPAAGCSPRSSGRSRSLPGARRDDDPRPSPSTEAVPGARPRRSSTTTPARASTATMARVRSFEEEVVDGVRRRA